MKLRKKLIVNGQDIPLVSDTVHLQLNRVGEGVFDVREESPRLRNALAEFYVGVGEEMDYLVMTGAITGIREMAPGRVRLTVRELSAVLEMPVIINLHQTTARQVLEKIERETGLRFLLPAGALYLDERHVLFRHYGRAIDALNQVGKIWGLKDTVWFQLPDGRMYWGHWTQGPYTKAEVPIEERLVSARDEKNHSLVLPYIPALRPGMLMNAGFRFRIDALTFAGETVKVEWKAV